VDNLHKQAICFALVLTTLLYVIGDGTVAPNAADAAQLAARNAKPSQAGAPGAVRRVNIPYHSGSAPWWAQTAIFWFGKNEQGIPSRNYIDVRVAYTAAGLHVRTTTVDYYLWYHNNPTPTDDLTQYDSVALYLDVAHDRAAAPQTDDYWFLIGARHWQDMSAYVRDARGNGTGWNTDWSPATDWDGLSTMSWSCNPGPNSNACGIDFGWTSFFTIPWETIGLSGPPPQNTVWGMGVQLYDRDGQPPAGYGAPEIWPETFATNSPTSWGELHFGYANYQPAVSVPEGSTLIRASSSTDNTVEDAWMGGGGLCASGHEGGSEINHGGDERLFVGTETASTHFPCFNKSFLRFSLAAIPPGKAITSATLTLHHWGNADPSQAQPSWVHLFDVRDPWDEMSIHWNNAPLAHENISATWINPLSSFPGWPGTAYNWDATQAVAEAYAEGRSANLAIYGSDSAQHSSKYLTSSETGDWNPEGRPTLEVHWGDPNPVNVNPPTQAIKPGENAIYTVDVHPISGFDPPYTLSTASPSTDLSIDLNPTVITPPAQGLMTVTDLHGGSGLMPGVWYTIPVTATAGVAYQADVHLLVGGSRTYLPVIVRGN
jgi:hypothetical protein